MNAYTVMNILDLVESVGEQEVQRGLSDFSCSPNKEIENFARKNAVEFAKRKLSITYLLLDHIDGEIAGFLTLAHKAIEKPKMITSAIRLDGNFLPTQGWIAILIPSLFQHSCLRR